MNRLIPMLELIKKNHIESVQINFNKEKLLIKLNEGSSLEFEGVRSLLYLENKDTIESPSIEYSDEGMMEFMGTPAEDIDTIEEYSELDFDNLISSPNFSILFRNKSLLFEANSVIYNGYKFNIGSKLN